MQMNPNTFKALQAKYPELQGKNLADPETNILAGAYYMKDMKAQFGSWDLALRAYNSGPNGVDRSNPNAIPAGTGDATYVQKAYRRERSHVEGENRRRAGPSNCGRHVSPGHSALLATRPSFTPWAST
ncbi:transglycosylase SLT domain-containing protein [Archangium lipolyticum]|uniref:transglycosylase SLT domain-containing protein n=1 Tax=Archangium lipolyticum TaxID=2970465 RepID=UPI00214C2822|nr:transglycosylase SLT domain-containing protein [Archangium lipolyticum]